VKERADGPDSRVINVGIVGLGKIARDQHVPALAANGAFRLLAGASPHSRVEGLACYGDIETLLDEVPSITAVALCTTPQARFEVAQYALSQRRHVLLEKPPGMTVSEVLALARLAQEQRVTLFASWHSRHGRAVEPARAWLSGRTLRAVTVTWKENVRQWHPGQAWIWRAGGLGVFDPGINALSILTRILPGMLRLQDAELFFPANCETPIAAHATFDSNGTAVRMGLDFLHGGAPSWDIHIDTDGGELGLLAGGRILEVGGRAIDTPAIEEYTALYAHFAALVHSGASDVDVSPLQLVADAFLCGRRVAVEAFIE
jgi:L-arabinose 1- dehydrogenase